MAPGADPTIVRRRHGRDTGSRWPTRRTTFTRQRRRAELSRLVSWLRREPDDVNDILPFDEVRRGRWAGPGNGRSACR